MVSIFGYRTTFYTNNPKKDSPNFRQGKGNHFKKLKEKKKMKSKPP